MCCPGAYFEGTGGSGRVGGGPGQGGRFCVDMFDSLQMMAIAVDVCLVGGVDDGESKR